MKYIIYPIIIFSLILSAFYTFLFSNYANDIAKAVIAQKLQSKIHHNVEVTQLLVHSLSDIDLICTIANSNTLKVHTEIHYLSQSIDAKYHLNITNPQTFHIDAQPFFVKGDLNATLAKINIKGVSNIYNATTNFYATLFEPSFNNFNINKLNANIDSAIAQGELKANLAQTNLKINFNKLQAKEILKLIHYPQFMKGDLTGEATYSLLTQKGVINANIEQGYFVQNKIFNAVKLFGFVNLYKESFNGDVHATLNKSIANANFKLHSKSAQLTSKDTQLDIFTQQIDSKMVVTVEGDPIQTHLYGNINKPLISVNLEQFLNSKVAKKIQKEALHFLDTLFH